MRHRRERRTPSYWWLTDHPWKACLWAGVGFTVLSVLSVFNNLPRWDHGLPWLLPVVMLLLAMLWFARAKAVYTREQKALREAEESVNNF